MTSLLDNPVVELKLTKLTCEFTKSLVDAKLEFFTSPTFELAEFIAQLREQRRHLDLEIDRIGQLLSREEQPEQES